MISTSSIASALPLDILKIIYEKVKTRYNFFRDLMINREIIILKYNGTGLIYCEMETPTSGFCSIYYSSNREYKIAKKYIPQLLTQNGYHCPKNTDYFEVWQKDIYDIKLTFNIIYDYEYDSYDFRF